MVERGIAFNSIVKRLHEKVQKKLDIPVSLAMRYGSLSIKKGLEELKSKGVDDVIVLPLYPHCIVFVRTVVEKIKSECKEWFLVLSFLYTPFYDDEMYINEMVKNIKNNLKGIDYDHILFSYRSIPESHLKFLMKLISIVLRLRTVVMSIQMFIKVL